MRQEVNMRSFPRVSSIKPYTADLGRLSENVVVIPRVVAGSIDISGILRLRNFVPCAE
jgi:hypothetical protein